MVKDIQKVIQNLLDFYDFQNKTIVSVGAGGGQFLAYAKNAKHVIAIDNDKQALNQLKERLAGSNLTEKFTLIHSDFETVDVKGDVVLFEFCMHEMQDQHKVVKHALGIASDIVITDHAVTSEWAYYADETEKSMHSWGQLSKFALRKIKTYQAEQYFQDYNELYDKVKVQGKNSIERIEKFKDSKNFIIPMEYTFAFLSK